MVYLLSYATQLNQTTRSNKKVDLNTFVQDIVSETQVLTYRGKAVVDGCDNVAVANPNKASARQCCNIAQDQSDENAAGAILTDVLGRTEFIRRTAQVFQAGSYQTPFHQWRPKEDCFRAYHAEVNQNEVNSLWGMRAYQLGDSEMLKTWKKRPKLLHWTSCITGQIDLEKTGVKSQLW